MAPQKHSAVQNGTKHAKSPTSAPLTAKSADADRPPRSSSKNGLEPKQPKAMDRLPKPDKNEELLKAFRSDLDALRFLVTCKICDRLLYEPYVISCGHTYCYSCLCTWFVNNRTRKTCPDCRALVGQLPAPAYLIREMAQIFINRADLLPDNETQQLHKQWQKEEADLVLQDKTNDDPRTGGLFKGCFRLRSDAGLRAIRDDEDGIVRCPMCAWELEDGECTQCRLQFDDNGLVTWGNSFNGFSDMDETSEHDMSGEDLDGDLTLDADDADLIYEDFGDGTGEFHAGLDGDHSHGVRRWLANAQSSRLQTPFGSRLSRHRPAAHSAAGSRRRSYSASASDMMTDDIEMGNIEEEDEDEDEEDEDSSMNDFIDDGESTVPSRDTPSTTSDVATPTPNIRGHRARRVVESESSSAASPPAGDDNDDGPVAPGGRRIQQEQRHRFAFQPNLRSHPPPPSSSSSEPGNIELDSVHDEEDMQTLLRDGWSPLEHEGDEEETQEDDDDSDGARTTVGWEPIAPFVERFRLSSSLTPTADRPIASIRPPSRTAAARFSGGSRGIRRRSSMLSAVSSSNYEDEEADDDDSEVDVETGADMRGPAVRPRGSRMRLRNGSASVNPRSSSGNLASGNLGENDTDDNSDDTAPPRGRRRPRLRAQRQEYDPSISWAFAQHMADLRSLNIPPTEALFDHF